jgi:hypothetical protein
VENIYQGKAVFYPFPFATIVFYQGFKISEYSLILQKEDTCLQNTLNNVS